MAWAAKSDKEEVYLHIGKSESDEKITHVIYVEHKSGVITDGADFETFNTMINGDSFMNIKWTNEENGEKEFYFIKYSVENTNILKIYALNRDLKTIGCHHLDPRFKKYFYTSLLISEILNTRSAFNVYDSQLWSNIDMLTRHSHSTRVKRPPLFFLPD